jgi:hypothetical protein
MYKIIVVILFSLVIPNTVLAELETFDQYDIHYSVLNTSFLSAEVANTYKITRGKDRAMINIAIREQLPNGGDKAKKVIISGVSTDLIRETPLKFTEIIEQDAIYYIAEFSFHHLEMAHFTIKVQPDPNKEAYTLKFSKTLYVD